VKYNNKLTRRVMNIEKKRPFTSKTDALVLEKFIPYPPVDLS